ncbi:hypothetical protein BABINDRAFT_159086 [Babjeviella inositovora NRRL Y-12698]|uniref:AMP-dependent synthetase/ligase domain-containing protein n=1 Tax=Babjeviella inositovora NRRL Y-12698 TaxID=984486 RepID=A0A1E3QY30_9ASCO|nr:uncharacterized protein BABINDRAFT_159086 [Babjeviella inositovora NRRL Y-12698]ODQ82511.1 hypothetical protein BABINDRAFT_159086 [Babjeviella inositovora NRRL Y-12698]
MSLFGPDYASIENLLEHHLPLPQAENDTAVAIPNTQEPGYSLVYRNKFSQNQLYATLHPSLSTLHEIFEYAVATYGNERCLGKRLFNNTEANAFDAFYTWQSFNEIAERKKNLGAGIIYAVQNNVFRKSLEGTDRDFIVALFSANTVEWALTDLACQSYSITNTALYPSLGPDTSAFILETTNCPMVVCSSDKLQYLIELKRLHGLPYLANLVLQTPVEGLRWNQLLSDARSAGIELSTLEELELLGKQNPIAYIPPIPETIYTISFTSGTTGLPKGVTVTHCQAGSHVTFAKSMGYKVKRGTALCFLPLAHIYQRCTIILCYISGDATGFPQSGSPLTLVDDMRALQPTILCSVPRVYTKMESAIKALTINGEDGFSKTVSTHIIKKRMQWMEKSKYHGSHFLYDNLLTKKLRTLLGLNKAVYVISGSAPISPETQKFFKAALNLGFTNGYGMTETASGICCTFPFEDDYTSSGPVGITCEVRLRDVPEMGYTANDEGGPRGELLMRGPLIFSGYYKNDEETAKAFDKDGWFLSGDIAYIDNVHGRIHIVDRVKNFFKLAQGEYVTPEKIENQYLSSCSFINQLYVHGDSLETYLVAVVGFEPSIMSRFIKQHFDITELDPAKLTQLLKEKRIKKRLVQEMNAHVAEFGLQGYEKVHNVHCEVEPLTLERDVVTPTMKIKRQICRKFFSGTLLKLYTEGSLIKDSRL